MFIDTHFHLTKEDYDNIDDVIFNAIEKKLSNSGLGITLE